MVLPFGKLICNRYIVNRLIGQGGMAEIYSAMDTFFHKPVAIKALKNSNLKNVEVESFKNEIRIASIFNNSHIEKIYNVGEYENNPFLVYELINGRIVKEVLDERGSFSNEETINYILQLLDGVREIHSHNILHNDLKPDNLMLSIDGAIKIVDFGIASHSDEGKFENLIGSAYYLDPEVVIKKEFTVQSDIYSLGIILFEFLTGKTPFMKSTTDEEIKAHMSENIPSINSYGNNKLGSEFDEVISRATNRNLKKRYNDVEEFIKDINSIKNGTFVVKNNIFGEIRKKLWKA